MVSREYKFLDTTRFATVTSWSAVAPITMPSAFSKSYNIRLATIIKRIKNPISIEDKTLYTRITIKQYGQGVIQRDTILGKDIGTKKQFVASGGQLIISGIDARNGSIGVVPNELSGAIVTNDFWLFDVSEKANTQYLLLLLSSERFQMYWQSKSSGTTNRQRINQNDLLAMEIPLPSLTIQQKIVAKYNAALTEAEQNETTVAKLEEMVDKILFDELEIVVCESKEEKCLYKYIKTVELSSINRWDIWNSKEKYTSNKYKAVLFESLIVGKPLYGANEKTVKEKSDVRYLRITDINEDGSLNDEVVSAEKVEEKYLLSENDFLIARSGNTVGKTFLYKAKYGKCLYAGYLIKFVFNTKKVIPEYILHYTKSALFKDWITSNQRVFGQPNINGQEYLKAPIIIPKDKATQQKIVNRISAVKADIKAYKQRAIHLRERAKKEFEEGVFGET